MSTTTMPNGHKTATVTAPPGRFVPGPFVPVFKNCGPIRPTLLPNGWAAAIIDINPDLATEMLQRNADNQRPLKTSVIERYAADMTAGRWRLTHQGIAFNSKGHLHDGQHRLSAVIAADTPVRFLVFFGAGDDPEMTVIDTHKTRTVVDAGRVLGEKLDWRYAAVANAMVRFGLPNGDNLAKSSTHSAKLAFIERHREVLDKVEGWFGTTKMAAVVSPAPVRAAVALAAYHLPDALLSRFVEILTDRVESEEHEKAAKQLRIYILSNDLGGGAQSRDLFLKGCRAIQNFEAGTVPARVWAATENPFPLQG
jgi:hypothetical protein